jgi:glycosyltransferase involved in cell wall biosynthesis
MNKYICFCIPYYKNLSLLKECVDSIQAQTVSRYKIIISEDLGGDPIPNGMFGADVKVVRSEVKLGLVGNFNRCFELSTESLTTILHSDDKLHPQYTEEMLRLSDKFPDADAYICRAAIINEATKKVFSLADWVKDLIHPFKNKIGVIHGDKHLARIVLGNYIFCPSLCFTKKEQFSANWLQVTDLELTTRIIRRGGKIISHPGRLFFYRRHTASLTSQNTNLGLRFEEESHFFDYILKSISKDLWPKTFSAAKLRITHRLNLILCVLKDILRCNFKNATHKFKILICKSTSNAIPPVH